jgi:structural maintenance of chromosomes protein 5
LAPKKADYESRFQDLRQRREDNARQSGIQQAEIQTAMQERQKLDDVKVQKLNQLRKWNRDHADAIEWLLKNPGRFQMEVFEPPVLSVVVPDQKYANAVESCFNVGQLLVRTML